MNKGTVLLILAACVAAAPISAGISTVLPPAGVVAAPLGAAEMDFSTYLDAYLAATTDIADAQKAFDDAVIAYEGGLARKASAIEVESLLATKDRKAMDLRDKKNQTAIDAYTLYYQYAVAAQAFQIADGRLQVAEESAKSDESQFKLGLISETQYLNKGLTLQNVRDSREAARRTLEDVARKIKRGLAVDTAPTFAAAADLDAAAVLADLAAVPLDKALAASAEILTAKSTLSIKEKSWRVVSTSAFAKDTEKEDAEDQYKTAQKTYKKAVETLEDSVITLERNIADLAGDYRDLAVNKRIAEIDVDSAALKKSYGESTELDYASARYDHQSKLNEAGQFSYKLVQKKLDALKMAGGDCPAYLKATMK